MRRDKAALEYHGRSQLAHAYDTLSRVVDRAFVSVRAEQAEDETRKPFPRIVDSAGVEGPLAGILSAQAREPDAAWLVVACDLPWLDEATLRHLLTARSAGGVATAELDPVTLQARRVPGLHFIGEVVDVTGWLGGYNFQWAWASAWCAAQALAKP
jgi:molybdopterin-guanine dinucleotide biosynthesis protein A